MQFKKIIGQYNIKKKLINTVTENRISHAQLFVGPKGCGKLSMAIAFAQYINCENKTENDSCGECSSCKKFEKLIHPDLHFVFPVIKNKSIKPISDSYITNWRQNLIENPYFTYNSWLNSLGTENKQAQIYSDESNEIIKKLSFKTYEAEYKVMIIWLPEKMNISASNKLLKILEEPPQKTLFLLVSDEQDKIISTILSRTQLVRFKKIDNENLIKALQVKFPDLSIDIINDSVNISDGNYFQAIEQIETSDTRKYNFEIFTKLMRLSFQKNIIELSELCDDIHKIGREKQKNFLFYANNIVRENFIYNINNSQKLTLNKDEKNFSKKFAQFINYKNIEQIQKELSLATTHIERNGNAKIIFMDLAIKLIYLLRL